MNIGHGSSWSIVASPKVGSTHLLQAVAVVPDSPAVWATGFYYRKDGNPSTLVQRWDGSAWSVIASLDGSTRENYLTGVGTTGPNDAWAVGYYNNQNGLYLALTEHWDGSSWLIVPSPSLSSSLTALTAVSSISATDVWAVGTYFGLGDNTPSPSIRMVTPGRCSPRQTQPARTLVRLMFSPQWWPCREPAFGPRVITKSRSPLRPR
ncbi:MAG TPA: hypothetical protein VH227_07230 [Candidatus Udaeobacter sp.]|nr:hypothetical protein [Candidatus Udaeobacter sp.]